MSHGRPAPQRESSSSESETEVHNQEEETEDHQEHEAAELALMSIPSGAQDPLMFDEAWNHPDLTT